MKKTQETLCLPSPLWLMAGGSQIRITANGIFLVTAGKCEIKAAQHQFVNGESVSSSLPELPKLGNFNLQFVIQDKIGQALQGKSFIIYDKEGKTVQTGTLDHEGKTPVLRDIQQKDYFIRVLEPDTAMAMEQKNDD